MSPRRLAPFSTSGPRSVIEATKLIDPDMVPFPWDLPPKDSIHVWQPGSIVAPANATPTTVCLYHVPDGFQFYLKARLNVLVGSNFVRGSGEVLWTTDVNTPDAVTAAQGEPVQGLQAEPFDIGSFAEGPVPFWGRKAFEPNDDVRVKVTTTVLTPGAPNYFTSILVGWIVPLR